MRLVWPPRVKPSPTPAGQSISAARLTTRSAPARGRLGASWARPSAISGSPEPWRSWHPLPTATVRWPSRRWNWNWAERPARLLELVDPDVDDDGRRALLAA